MILDPELAKLMNESVAQGAGIGKISLEEQHVLHKWALHIYAHGQTLIKEIQEVSQNGKMITLANGSRCAVDDVGAAKTILWSTGDQVIVVGNLMHHLSEATRVNVLEVKIDQVEDDDIEDDEDDDVEFDEDWDDEDWLDDDEEEDDEWDDEGE